MTSRAAPRHRLRLATPEDARAMLAIYVPIVRDTPISFEVDPPDEAAFARSVADTLPALPWLVCEVGGLLAGYAYASMHRARAAYRWSVDVSVYVHDSYRRQGAARSLYAALFRILRAQGYHRAHAGIALPNDASVALHESLGFLPVGVYRAVGYKLGAWHDVGWWQLELLPPHAPSAPKTVAEIRNGPEWDRCLSQGLARAEGGS